MKIDLDLEELGKALLDRAKTEAGEAWDFVKDEIQDAGKDYAKLVAASLRGEDVDADLRHATARIANWSWVGADRVRASWAVLLEEIARTIGKTLKNVAKGLLGI